MPYNNQTLVVIKGISLKGPLHIENATRERGMLQLNWILLIPLIFSCTPHSFCLILILHCIYEFLLQLRSAILPRAQLRFVLFLYQMFPIYFWPSALCDRIVCRVDKEENSWSVLAFPLFFGWFEELTKHEKDSVILQRFTEFFRLEAQLFRKYQSKRQLGLLPSLSWPCPHATWSIVSNSTRHTVGKRGSFIHCKWYWVSDTCVSSLLGSRQMINQWHWRWYEVHTQLHAQCICILKSNTKTGQRVTLNRLFSGWC